MLPYQFVNFHAALDKEEKNLSDTLYTFDTITTVIISCFTVHV
ncbi:hypothetical protein SOPHIAROSE_165 [Escherichia phage vB_EcoM_SophiaRose]|uniref:Uncharacterized protein n=1 Tax=Escherichia phage vB_EcoM_SophiaRose TaxID=2836106 RepID=A0AAE7S8B0_9CAUD|nr:hypothetical protein SOPHIAROSE_165 [Escherichia phage vB_EcoM_SophiaRose]